MRRPGSVTANERALLDGLAIVGGVKLATEKRDNVVFVLVQNKIKRPPFIVYRLKALIASSSQRGNAAVVGTVST